MFLCISLQTCTITLLSIFLLSHITFQSIHAFYPFEYRNCMAIGCNIETVLVSVSCYDQNHYPYCCYYQQYTHYVLETVYWLHHLIYSYIQFWWVLQFCFFQILYQTMNSQYVLKRYWRLTIQLFFCGGEDCATFKISSSLILLIDNMAKRSRFKDNEWM